MSSDFHSSQSQDSQAVELNSKISNSEAGKQTLKQNERKEKETLNISPSQNHGVLLTGTSSTTTSLTVSNSTPDTDVIPQTVVDSMIKQGFPALAKTTKPIPASVFSYRFASASNNQTPYYISPDIVLSGGIAQQTRRRIVHNEVERRRKDKINGWITKLSEVIPKCAYGKQSKNIVLENAVEYFSELNQKLKIQEEALTNKNKLELENQSLKHKLQLLQNQNTELTELLERNNISVPQSLKAGKNLLKEDAVGLQTSKANDSLNGITNITDNTNVTWSSSGVVPISCTTTSSQVQLDSVTSIGTSINHVASSAQQVQPSFSMYTVSSIMNDSSPNVSLVNSTIQNNPGTVTFTIPVQVPAATSNESSTTALPIVVTPNVTSHALNSFVPVPNMSTPIASIGTACNSDITMGNTVSNPQQPAAKLISLNKPQQGVPQGTLLGNSPQRIMVGSSATEGVTQVVLCQGTVPQNIGPQGTTMVNVAKGPLVGSVGALNAMPVTCPLSSNTGLVIHNQGPIMTLGASNTPQSSSNTRSRPVVANTAIAPSSTIPFLTTLPNNGGLTLQHAVTPSRVTPSLTHHQVTNQPCAVIGKATFTTPSKIAVVSHSVLSNRKTPVTQNKTPLTTVETPSSIHPFLTANPAAVLVNKGFASMNSVTPSVSLPNSHSVSSNGLVLQSQGPILSLGTPSATQTLSSKRTVANSLGSAVPGQTSLSGSMAVVDNPIAAISALANNNTGMITGTPVAIAPNQTQLANIQVIPAAAMTTQTNTFTSNTNPVTLATNGVANITTASTQQPGLVTLKLPKATIHPVSSTTKTSNRFNTGNTSSVNLTPSPGTAFVIVRSAPSQQPIKYPILPAQSISNYPGTNQVITAKSTPTAIVQPTIQQPSGPFQIPFTVIPAATPVVNAVTTTRTSSTSKRSHVSSVAQSRTISTPSPQPPAAKVAKHGKKRQSSRATSDSKSKAPKQKTKDKSKVNANASPSISTAQGNGSNKTHRNASNTDVCQQDMLSSQTFNISSLIPDIQSPNKNNPSLNSSNSTNPENKKSGGGTPRTKSQQTTLRLSHSIDSLTGRRQEQTTTMPHLPTQNMLSFSAESLLGSGDDLVSSLQTMSCTTANNTFTPQSTLTMTSFQDSTADGSINQTFSNFSAEALISETDFMGITNDTQSSRSNFTQGNQSVKSTPARTQMFSDFSAESLINTSDLGSGLSYAIDNLISRSDNNENNIAMTTVNPNLLHSSTSNILQDNIGHSLFTHSTSVPKNFSLAANSDFQNSNTATDSNNFAKYNGFTSPQKQSKEVFSFKPNSTLAFTSSTTSPTYLKHSVDSITASQYNTVGSSAAGMFGSSINVNTLAAPSFNSLFSLDQMNSQYQTTGNPFPLTSNLTRTSYQGPTMGSYA